MIMVYITMVMGCWFRQYNTSDELWGIVNINTRLILDLLPANERRRYFVTTSLIGWVQAYNQPYNTSICATNMC